MNKKPTHNLTVKSKNGKGAFSVVGACWWDAEKQSMGIQLNPCVVLTAKDEVWISAYPNRESFKKDKPLRMPKLPREPTPSDPEFYEDDFPF